MPPPFGPFLSYESRVMVFGLPRYGKTRLVRDTLTRDAQRVIWHDVTGHDYMAEGRLPLSIEELEQHSYLLGYDNVRIVVIARDAGDADLIVDEASRIARLVFQYHNIVLVYDEAQSHHRKSEKLINGIFARGNHSRIVPIIASQTAVDVALGARKTCSDCYCFGQHHPRELKEIYDCYGDLFAEAVTRLRKGDNPVHWRESEREKWWSKSTKFHASRVE